MGVLSKGDRSESNRRVPGDTRVTTWRNEPTVASTTMAPSMGFEPTTFSSTGSCSDQLSYDGKTQVSPRQDSNLRPPGSKPGALPLSYGGEVLPVGVEPTCPKATASEAAASAISAREAKFGVRARGMASLDRGSSECRHPPGTCVPLGTEHCVADLIAETFAGSVSEPACTMQLCERVPRARKARKPPTRSASGGFGSQRIGSV